MATGGGFGSGQGGVSSQTIDREKKWEVLDVYRVLAKDTNGLAASTWTTVYTAPERVRANIKMINIMATTASTFHVLGRLVDQLNQNLLLFSVQLNGLNEFARPIEQGEEMVIEPTWSLQLFTENVNMDYIVTGTEQREQQ